jgi:hypothetical protein
LALKAPPLVLALLEAMEQEARDGANPDGTPCYVSLAAVAERTRLLSPRAQELAHAGHGPDSALVLGWPSNHALAAAFEAAGSSSSTFQRALLASLPPDDPLWEALRNAATEAADDAGAAAALRLRVSWHRPFLDPASKQRLHEVQLRLEAAPARPRDGDGDGGGGSWAAERAAAWRAHLSEQQMVEGGVARELPAEAHGARRLGTAVIGQAAKSAAEAAALPGAETRLWFRARDGERAAEVHAAAAAAAQTAAEEAEWGEATADGVRTPNVLTQTHAMHCLLVGC